jgi:hypothetical protein
MKHVNHAFSHSAMSVVVVVAAAAATVAVCAPKI